MRFPPLNKMEETREQKLERLGKIYFQASQNAELEKYLGSEHPIYNKH